MVARYMLDTNIVSHLVREPQGVVGRKIAVVGEAAVCTSIIVAAELRFGALKSGTKRLKTRVDQILAAMDVVPLDLPVDRHYAEIRSALARKRIPIGPNELLISAHARALARTIHDPTAADADMAENARRARCACSTYCQVRLRALRSAPPRVFGHLDALASRDHE
jgi:tRNA(fMet)-specific endonuclease VapC